MGRVDGLPSVFPRPFVTTIYRRPTLSVTDSQGFCPQESSHVSMGLLLLLQKAAVLLSAAVPATRPHAVRLPRAAVCDADRQKRPIGVLAAICNAGRLLATAAHGGREDRRGRYRAKQDRGYAGHSPKTVPAGISFHIDCLRRAVLSGNSVTCSVRP